MGVPLFNKLTNKKELTVGYQTAASTKNVSGYSIIQAENTKQAKSLMNGHPHLIGGIMNTTLRFMKPCSFGSKLNQ